MQMRKFRILLASVMLAAALGWLLLGAAAPSFMRIAEISQIIPSAFLSCLGTTVFWLVATLLFGRVYCATVCPVGTMQDIAIMIGRRSSKKRAFRYHPPLSIRYPILLIYIVSLAAGVLVAGYITEPWNMMRNAASIIQPSDTAMTWGTLGGGFSGKAFAIGAASGVAALAAIMLWARKSGKAFCSEVCPIGSALGLLHQQTLMHIVIDPDKCISCMKCEDVCSCRCIKVEKRAVDNSRCVRCFDCIDVCPNGAIRFQINKGRSRQNPLFTPS